MASLMQKNGRWTLQFRVTPRSDRQTVALGARTEAQAQTIRERVEALVDALRADRPPDKSTAAWVAALPDDLHAKLARAALVTSRTEPNEGPDVPLLGRFLDSYIARRTDVKGSTAMVYSQGRRRLVEYFGATRPLDRITPGDADDWRRWLAADQGLADNTVRRRCGTAKQFFRAAVRRRLIAENPFADMAGCTVCENRARDRFITRQEAQAVLDSCPDAEWRLLFALSRYGGLRCPSEHLGLRWEDVDWERSRINVRSPKTERHKGKESRLVPIFPELRSYLEAVWDQAETGATWIIVRHHAMPNLHTQLERIIRRAGLEPWPKLWQNLRATRATELVAAGWSEYKVCAWLGHTEAVAKRHYWQVTDEDFQRAAAGGAALQIALQISDATPCKAVQPDFRQSDAKPGTASDCSNPQPIAEDGQEVSEVFAGLRRGTPLESRLPRSGWSSGTDRALNGRPC